ncbi:MAG: hypothetical protein ACE5I5_16270 [Candidatus Heimdallarchaeota archaeon]
MKKQKFANFLRPKLTRRRKAEIKGRHIGYAIIVIVAIFLFVPYLQAGVAWVMERIGAPPVKPITDDGIYDINLSRVNTVDKLNENAAVTATAGWMSINGGPAIAASASSGYMEWSGTKITEGDTLTIECQGSANHYPQLRTFTVGDINAGTYDLTYYIIGTMELWGMDQSEDAGVMTVMTGTDLLYNGTAEEDQLAADAGTEYPYVINVNADGFDEEYFGVEEYTQISGMKYTYVPAIYIKASTADIVDAVAQDGVALKELYVTDDGTSHHYIFQFIPMREDEDLVGDGQYKITFMYTPDAASGDTLDITFHPETRLDRAKVGILSQTATETIAQLTTT